jgi:hypothetical protein
MDSKDPRNRIPPPMKWAYFQGYIFKEMIRSILEESEYQVMPFGWETFLSNLKRDIKNIKTDAVFKIKVAPDLIVHDSEIFELVEVKVAKGNLMDKAVFLAKNSKKYWPEAIFVLITPFKHWFYAEKFENIDFEKNPDDFISQFKPFEEIFQKVKVDTLYQYKKIANQIFPIFVNYQMKIENCPELYETITLGKECHNEHLKKFLNLASSNDDNELYKQYLKECLVTRNIFDYDLQKLRSEK